LDYAEGLFLGKLWSDTDFENRRHVELFLLYGVLTSLFMVYMFWTGSALLGVGAFGTISAVMLILLSICNPLICFRYYRMPLWGKIIVLLAKVFKAYLVMSLTVSLVIPRITVKSDGLKDYLVDFLNQTLENYTGKFSGSSSFSTVMGVLAGGIHVVFAVVLVIAALLVIPGLVVLIYKSVQYLYDLIVDRLILRKFFKYK